MNEVQSTLEATISTVSSKATGAGSAVTLYSWFTASDLGMWIGILIGLGGLAVNWYFKRKADKRYEEAHVAFLDSLKVSNSPHTPIRQEGE